MRVSPQQHITVALQMGVGAYIIAWTGHLVRGLIAEYNSVPPTAVSCGLK